MTGDASKLSKHSGSGNGKYNEKKGIFSERRSKRHHPQSQKGMLTGGRQTCNGGEGR